MSAASTGTKPDRMPVLVLLVVLGGALGTAAREALLLAFPQGAGFPLTVFLINLVGAFILGLLLEALARRGSDAGSRRRLRLTLGTGFCGGFTTYSTFAVAGAELLASEPGIAVAYGLGTVVVGAVVTIAGMVAGAAMGARKAVS